MAHGRITVQQATILDQVDRGGNVDEIETDTDHASITLLIRHPSEDLDVVSDVLGLTPHGTRKKGTKRFTPRGTPLEGVWPDYLWSHSWLVDANEDLPEIWDKVIETIDSGADILNELNATGAIIRVIARFPSGKHMGFDVSSRQLMRMSQLGIALGFEVFE